MAEQLVRDLVIKEALKIRIKATSAHKNQPYVQCCSLAYYNRHRNKLKVTVTYDKGWQKRSYGRRYDSYSGNSFIICAISKGVIGMFLYSNFCQKCDDVDIGVEEVE